MAVRDRVNDHRNRLRAKGYRPVQMWVPDVRTPAFTRDAARQSELVADSETTSDDQDFLEAVSVSWDEE